MKIYFAASIRSGREDKLLYLELINCLRSYGQVLTEHIGDQDLTEEGEQEVTDERIYERDMSWLEESDVFVAEVSTPSTGVGYEIKRAEELKKRILCLYKPQQGKRLSPMVSGNKNMPVKKYKTLEEAVQHIEEFFTSLKA